MSVSWWGDLRHRPRPVFSRMRRDRTFGSIFGVNLERRNEIQIVGPRL